MTVDRRRLPRSSCRSSSVRAREARKALGDLGWAGVEFGKEIPATSLRRL